MGVGAVVWRGGEVLLERRGQPPAQGSWSLPGGLVDVGETLEQAVRREVREECSIEVEVGPLLGVFEPIVRDDDGRIRYHYVVIDYLARYVGGDVADRRRRGRAALGCRRGAGRLPVVACDPRHDRARAAAVGRARLPRAI